MSIEETMSQFQRRILIVEDDPFIGSLIVGALANEGFVPSLAATALEAKKQAKNFDPDVVIVDIDLGEGPNGIEFIQMLKKTQPEVAAILLSKHADTKSAGINESQIPEGVAYLRKSLIHNTQTLVETINSVTKGTAVLVRQDLQSKGSIDLLTKAQLEILRLMALGFSNKEIARQRDVSISSVEQRVSEIFKAFGISQSEAVVPRVEAIRRYIAEAGIPER
jgi:DNA-binding NarL/FixJ family response regulator